MSLIYCLRGEYFLANHITKYGNFSNGYINSFYITEGNFDRYAFEQWTNDEAAKSQITTKRRAPAKKVGSDYHYEFVMMPNDSFLNENTPLLPNIELKLVFDRLPAQYSLFSSTDTALQGEVLPLTDVYCMAEYVTSPNLRHHFDSIQYEPIQYEYDEIMTTCKNLPTGEQFIRIDNICGGNTPDYIFIGICLTEGLNGSLEHSSTCFEAYDIQEFDLTLNGSSLNNFPMKITNRLPIWPYVRFCDNLSLTAKTDSGEILDLEDFKVRLFILSI